MTRDHSIENCVTAYAIFRTEGVGIDRAMDFIFERRSRKMQHPYFGYLPAGAPLVPVPGYSNDENEFFDLEKGEKQGVDGNAGEFGIHEVCYIC